MLCYSIRGICGSAVLSLCVIFIFGIVIAEAELESHVSVKDVSILRP